MSQVVLRILWAEQRGAAGILTSAGTCGPAPGVDCASGPVACSRQQKSRVSALAEVECTTLLRLCAALVAVDRLLAGEGWNSRHTIPGTGKDGPGYAKLERQALLCQPCHLTKGRTDLQHLPQQQS